MKETNKILSHFFSTDKFLDYRKICMQFFDTKVDKSVFGYEKFMELIGVDTINEATKNNEKIYPADGRFYQLLGWRYALIIKEMPHFVLKENFNHYTASGTLNWMSNYEEKSKHEEAECLSNQIPLEKIVNLTTNLLDQVEQGKYKAKQISVKFFKIAKQLKITHFLGIPIDEFSCIKEAKALNKQKRNYHNKRFKSLLSSHISSTVFKKQADSVGINYFRVGVEYREKATALERFDLTQDIFSLFKCFLNYLTASFYFKEALKVDPNLFLGKYNYAYSIKRLGFINEAIDELNSFDLNLLSKHQKLIVLENLGDCYGIKAKNQIHNQNNHYEIKYNLNSALTYFEKAYTLAQHDVQILYNLIEILYLKDVQENKVEHKEKIDLYIQISDAIKFNSASVFNKLVKRINKYYNNDITFNNK